jgi:hypothetical protein
MARAIFMFMHGDVAVDLSRASKNRSISPPTNVMWQGTGQVQGRVIASLQYRVSDSRGGVQMVTVSYTKVGTASSIQPPSRLPS